MSATPILAAGETPETQHLRCGRSDTPDATGRFSIRSLIDSGVRDRTAAASAGLVDRPHFGSHRHLVSELDAVVVARARARAGFAFTPPGRTMPAPALRVRRRSAIQRLHQQWSPDRTGRLPDHGGRPGPRSRARDAQHQALPDVRGPGTALPTVNRAQAVRVPSSAVAMSFHS